MLIYQYIFNCIYILFNNQIRYYKTLPLMLITTN
nr:MAG TPA: hypothetical protein [Caudoviricetes sp.]